MQNCLWLRKMSWFFSEIKRFEKQTKFLVQFDTVHPWWCSGYLPTFPWKLPDKNLLYKYRRYLTVYCFVTRLRVRSVLSPSPTLVSICWRNKFLSCFGNNDYFYSHRKGGYILGEVFARGTFFLDIFLFFDSVAFC